MRRLRASAEIAVSGPYAIGQGEPGTVNVEFATHSNTLAVNVSSLPSPGVVVVDVCKGPPSSAPDKIVNVRAKV